jgi:hypothetical protein
MISRRYRPRHAFFDLIHEDESEQEQIDRELDAADRDHDIGREDEQAKEVPAPPADEN